MKVKQYELVLRIPISFYDGDDCHPQLAPYLQYYLREWEEGRFPFPVEMVKEGLWNCIKKATEDCIAEDCHKKFGDMMVQVNETTRMPRWRLEAQTRKRELPHVHEKIEVEINERNCNG